jgi:hypothetical protein
MSQTTNGNNKLTPANYDQYFPAKVGQGFWLFQYDVE